MDKAGIKEALNGKNNESYITPYTMRAAINKALENADIGGGGGSSVELVKVGSTTTGDPGTNAKVTDSGSDGLVVLDFLIPRGVPGATGPQGETGPQGPPGSDAEIQSLTNEEIEAILNNFAA